MGAGAAITTSGEATGGGAGGGADAGAAYDWQEDNTAVSARRRRMDEWSHAPAFDARIGRG